MTNSLTQEEKDWLRKAYWYDPPHVINGQIGFYQRHIKLLSDKEKETLEVLEELQKEMNASEELKKYHKNNRIKHEIKELESRIEQSKNHILKWDKELNRLRAINDN